MRFSVAPNETIPIKRKTITVSAKTILSLILHFLCLDLFECFLVLLSLSRFYDLQIGSEYVGTILSLRYFLCLVFLHGCKMMESHLHSVPGLFPIAVLTAPESRKALLTAHI